MRRVLTIAALAALAVVAWLYWQKSRVRPAVVSGFIEADQVRVGSRIGGRVSDVIAREGQSVAKGDVLYHLDPFDLQERLAEAKAQLAAQQAEHERLRTGFRREEIGQARARRDRFRAVFDRLQAGPRQGEIDIAREEANVARANLDFAEAEYERISGLQRAAEAARTEIDQATRAVRSARAQMASAQERLDLLEEGTRPEEIAEAGAALSEAELALGLLEAGYRQEDIAEAAAAVAAAAAHVGAIEAQVAELTVVSPCACVIEAIELRPGDLVAANAPTVALLDLSHLWVRAYVPEPRLGAVRLGETVSVSVNGFPDERFTAAITYISQEAEFTPRNVQTPEERSKQVFRIKVSLQNGVDRLRVGMTADVWLPESPSQ